MLVYLPRIQKIEESDLLQDHAAISTFGDLLEGAVRADSLTWLAARTVGPDERKGRSKEIPGFPDADQRIERRKLGWTYWTELYHQFGHFDLLKQYTGSDGPHLIFRAFDGEKPVYTDLLLGEQDGEIILLDWTEQPGSLSEGKRQAAFEELAAKIGKTALQQTVMVLIGAATKAEAGNPAQALEDIQSLPPEWRSNPLVAGDQLRIMADAGDPNFPQAVLKDGGLLSAPAIAHLAFCWSLKAGDAEGLRRSTADLREQFGEDSLLMLYEGIADQWQGDCEQALNKMETVIARYPNNPVLPVHTLNCLAQQDPEKALARLNGLLPGTGFTMDELDTWLAMEVPALYVSPIYHEWRLTAPATF